MGLRRLITEFLWPPSSSIIRLWLPYSTKVLGKTNQTSPNSMGLRRLITEFLWPPSSSIIRLCGIGIESKTESKIEIGTRIIIESGTVTKGEKTTVENECGDGIRIKNVTVIGMDLKSIDTKEENIHSKLMLAEMQTLTILAVTHKKVQNNVGQIS
ncbi:hypothetical protein EVAR_24104_1 [Eumeta japonica]|uniref:Uncharacterized protein n=1 Tax=Eumeta variegata TaxID=151549 RepID=A0A4C2A153_EUMVA|nr:hypothetical protein EVAR_24104_1 [Eumeta japonica]